MKKLVLSLLLCAANFLKAQNYSNNYENKSNTAYSQVRYSIYTVGYKDSKATVEHFIKSKKYEVVNQNETKDTEFFEFWINEIDVPLIDSLCNKLGYVNSKVINSYNTSNKLFDANLELERLLKKKKDFELMLARIDSVKSDKYYQHWEKIREIDAQIYETKKHISHLEAANNVYLVTITVNDEQTSPSNSKINYVHMPGAEYVYLFTETPRTGLTYAAYQGVFLKYLFTKGKSYFSLGALKALEPNKDDKQAYSELFCFNFGQDWYSRHFGRGNNKFMNLYIGYHAGYTLAYNQVSVQGMPYVSPGAGLELFKNKYILIDSSVNYYLPITENNRYTRGIRLASSINFSF